MDALSYKTTSLSKENVEKKWYVVNAEGQTVGRIASKIANILRGKHKVSFTPHIDCGDNVIVVNAEKVRFTGKKMNNKQYVRHTGYPGGQRFMTPRLALTKKPEFILEHAVKGMLPKNRLGRQMFKSLHVYVGNAHPHQAQQPVELK